MFICEKFYISKILSEVEEYINIQSNSIYFSKDDITKTNENKSYCHKFDLKLTDKDGFLPIMHWLQTLHKTPIGAARFIIASKNCITKPLPDVISKLFKFLFKHVENFQNKSKFYSSYKKF